jgi:hypothetical protein
MINYKILGKLDSAVFLRNPDEFTDQMNLTNIKFVNKNLNTKTEYLDHLSKATMDFNNSEINKLDKILGKINDRLVHLDLRVNLNIGFIKTNGSDSFDLPYTRGSNVILPSLDGEVPGKWMNLGLIAHEIFHIITRKNPEIRQVLYSLVGFYNAKKEIITNQDVPGMIVNPDALSFSFYAKCEINGSLINVIPLIMIGKSEQDMEWVKLLVIDEQLNNTTKLVSLKDTDFHKRYSHASSYVSHPEEICAESFRNLVINKNVNELFFNTLKRIFIEKQTVTAANFNNTNN